MTDHTEHPWQDESLTMNDRVYLYFSAHPNRKITSADLCAVGISQDRGKLRRSLLALEAEELIQRAARGQYICVAPTPSIISPPPVRRKSDDFDLDYGLWKTASWGPA